MASFTQLLLTVSILSFVQSDKLKNKDIHNFLDTFSQVDEDQIEAFLLNMKEKDGLSPNELIELETKKSILRDPIQATAVYLQSKSDDDVVKLFTGGLTEKEMSDVSSNPVSQALEFVLDCINNAIELETELNVALSTFHTWEKNIQQQLASLLNLNQAMGNKIAKIKSQISEFKKHRLPVQEMLDSIRLHLSDYSDMLKPNNKISSSILKDLNPTQMATLQKEAQQKYVRLSAMLTNGLGRAVYTLSFVKDLDIFGDEDLSMSRDHVEFNPSTAETLLKKYQKLEGLRNNAMIKVDEKTKMEIELEIKTMETEIFHFEEEHKADLLKLISVIKSTVFRTTSKMVNLDLLSRKILKGVQDAAEMISECMSLTDKCMQIIKEASKLCQDRVARIKSEL